MQGYKIYIISPKIARERLITVISKHDQKSSKISQTGTMTVLVFDLRNHIPGGVIKNYLVFQKLETKSYLGIACIRVFTKNCVRTIHVCMSTHSPEVTKAVSILKISLDLQTFAAQDLDF